MLVRRANMFPVECVARGYLAGSGWKDYQATGKVCGIPLPTGLQDGSRLPEPMFTPATKSQGGAHDENISFDRMAEVIGAGDAAAIAAPYAGDLRQGRGPCRIARADPRGYQIRVWQIRWNESFWPTKC